MSTVQVGWPAGVDRPSVVRAMRECIEYTSLINIRPSQDNRSMEVQDAELRARIRALTFRLIGCGGPLS